MAFNIELEQILKGVRYIHCGREDTIKQKPCVDSGIYKRGGSI